MSDLIDRQAAIDALAKAMPSLTTPDGSGAFDHDIQITDEAFVDAMQIIQELPSAQPERKNGAWINEGRIIRCNRCKIGYATVKGMKSALTYKFCPNCGARMEGDHETD